MTEPVNSHHSSESNVCYIAGNLFNVPSRSVIGHACNCTGSWDDTIAVVFKSKFPNAYQTYYNHCKTYSSNPYALLGSCLLIHNQYNEPGGEYWIACLFTAISTNSNKDDIIRDTRSAVKDLLRQLHTHNYIGTLNPGDEYFPTISLPLIHTDSFDIPWQHTEAVLKSFPYQFNIYTSF